MTAFLRRGGLCLAGALLLGACGTPTNAISKVKIYRLPLDTNQPGSSDRAIVFERRHRLHGAVTSDDLKARSGNYYTVFWSLADTKTKEPVTLRFRYRQAVTGPKIHVIDQRIDHPKSSNIAEFQVIGEAYEKQGKILAWQLELRRGNEVLATRQSYLWK